MTECFFPHIDEEYTAASWLTTLKVMQVGADYFPSASITGRVCQATIKEPEEVLDRFAGIVGSPIAGNSGYDFMRQIGAIDQEGRVTQGLSDAALLLCDEPIAAHVKERTTFSRLVPIIAELAVYYEKKFITDQSHATLQDLPGYVRFNSIRVESDFYLRQYDE